MMTNHGNRITQGQFSFLPNLTDTQIAAQVSYALGNGWAIGIEHTDDPHPRNTYWEMYGEPLFDLAEPAAVMREIDRCRKIHRERYVRVTAFDSTRGWETPRMSFIVARPTNEPGYGLVRQEAQGRVIRYTIRPYATDRPETERYR